MQKKIIALAIAAAFSAPAFADTNVYGLVDVAVAHVSADGQQSDTQVISGGLSTSRLGVKNVEDLGNGIKSLVVLEYKVDAAVNSASNNFSARQQMVGLTGDFGTAVGGYLQTAGYDWAVKYNPVEGSTVSPLGNLTTGKFLIGSVAIGARAQRALAYISPNLSGATVAVNYTTGLDGATEFAQNATQPVQNKSSAYLLSVDYAGVQNLDIGFVYAHATIGTGFAGLGSFAGGTPIPAATWASETSTLSPTEYALGASYDFGVAKLFATYQNFKTGTNNLISQSVSNKAESISAVIPAGPGAVALSYAKNSIDSQIGNNLGASGETAAYLWNLSKDDTVYFAYSKMSQDSGTSAYSVDNGALSNDASGVTTMKAGGGSSLIAVGLRKKF